MRESKFRELLENNCELSDFYIKFVNDAPSESEFEFKDGSTLKFKCLEQYGGEGQGDDYWVVFSVTDEQLNETTNYRLDGWYASYHGHEFHDYNAFYEAEPVEVMVIEWRKKS